MIQPLRRQYRWLLPLLAIFLCIAFIAGHAVRQRPLTTNSDVPSPAAPPNELSRLLFASDNLWPTQSISTRLYGDAQPATRFELELQPRLYLKSPDILVYWSPDSSFSIPDPANESYLVGTLSGTETRRFKLPEMALSRDGFLVLYSLAQQRKLATAKMEIGILQMRRAAQ